MSHLERADVGRLLGLLVHDLRNPAATFGANIEFLTEVGSEDEDAREALEDLGLALSELKRGLELVSYIGRWLMNEPAGLGGDGELEHALPPLADELADFEVRVDLPPGPLRVANVQAVTEIVRVLLANARHHARAGGAAITAQIDAEDIVVTVQDAGPALPPELQEAAITVGGQGRIKGQPNGRYARFAGLLAAHAIAQSAGLALEFGGEDGAARFGVRAPRA